MDRLLYRHILSSDAWEQEGDVDFTPSTSTSTSLSLPPSLLLHSSASASTGSIATRLTTPSTLSLSHSGQYQNLSADVSLANSYFNQKAWPPLFAGVCGKDKDKPSTYQPWPPSSSVFSSSSFSYSARSPIFADPAPFVFDPFGCDDVDICAPMSIQSDHVGLMDSHIDDAEQGLDLCSTTSVPFVFAPIGLPDVDSTFDLAEAHNRIEELPAHSDEQRVLMSRLAKAIGLADPVPDITIADPPSEINSLTSLLDTRVASWADFEEDNLDIPEDAVPETVLTHNGISYTITGELGHGTYGQVVFARTSLGEEVAIKITSKVARDGDTLEKLRSFVLNERNILVRMAEHESPHLTKPLACFQDEDNVYFVMVGSLFVLPGFDC